MTLEKDWLLQGHKMIGMISSVKIFLTAISKREEGEMKWAWPSIHEHEREEEKNIMG